jgi:hypothetical protein
MIGHETPYDEMAECHTLAGAHGVVYGYSGNNGCRRLRDTFLIP